MRKEEAKRTKARSKYFRTTNILKLFLLSKRFPPTPRSVRVLDINMTDKKPAQNIVRIPKSMIIQTKMTNKTSKKRSRKNHDTNPVKKKKKKKKKKKRKKIGSSGVIISRYVFFFKEFFLRFFFARSKRSDSR